MIGLTHGDTWRLSRVAVAALLAVSWFVPQAMQKRAAAAIPPTYKILTYNAQGLPETPFSDSIYGDYDAGTRGALIAQKVIDGGYDIAVFNEVFDESMRTSLIAELSATLPFHVDKLYSQLPTALPTNEDSGLMVFSRFPFLPLPAPAFPSSECYTAYWTAGSCRAAFHAFTGGTFPEFLSDKGIAWTRFSNPITARPINVFFTHTQADYKKPVVDILGVQYTITKAESEAARAKQIDQIVSFMNDWAPAGGRPAEDTVLMGDLNVIAGSAEYQAKISGGGLASVGLEDPWMLRTSPEDPGFSYDNINSVHMDDTDRQRLDYTLWRPGSSFTSPPPCFQHQTLERHFKAPLPGGGETDLSDHFGVAAVIGPTGARCRPEIAFPFDFEGTGSFNLGFPNAFQWFRYNTPGTYTFSVPTSSAGAISLDFFDVTDLSTPLKIFEGTQSISSRDQKAVIAPPGPFYLRVSAINSSLFGSYLLSAHRHECLSFAEYCVIDPHRPLQDQGQMLASAQPPAAQTVYLLRTIPLWTFTAGAGTKQDLSFAATTGGGLKLSLSLYRRQDVINPLLSNGASYLNAPLLLSPGFTNPAAGVIPGDGAEYFLVLNRQPLTFGTYSTRWTTNLAMMDLKNLRCLEQEDATFDDSIYLNVSIDNLPYEYVVLGDFDTNQAKNISWGFFPNPHAIPIAKQVSVKVYEYDSDSADDLLGEKDFTPSSLPTLESSGWTPYTGDDAHYRLSWRTWRNVSTATT